MAKVTEPILVIRYEGGERAFNDVYAETTAENLKANLTSMAGYEEGSVRIKIVDTNTANEDLAISFARRINAIQNGINQLNIAPALKAGLDQVGNTAKAALTKHDIKANQHAFRYFLAKAYDVFKETGLPHSQIVGLIENVDQFTEMSKPPETLCTLHDEGNSKLSIRMERQLPSLDEATKAEFLQIKALTPAALKVSNLPEELPAWFKAKDYGWRAVFHKSLQGVSPESINRGEMFLSTRGEMPGTRNFFRHTHATIDTNTMVVSDQNSLIRSSNVANREFFKTLSEEEQVDMAYRALERGYEEAMKGQTGSKKPSSFMLQSLISPMGPILTALFRKPDARLHQITTKAVARLQEEHPEATIYHTNHGINVGGFFTPVIGRVKLFGFTVFKGTRSAREAYRMINAAKEDLNNYKNESSLLRQAANALEGLLKPNLFQALRTAFVQNSMREMYLAAYEELLHGEMGGISQGFCVSGKDRKGMQVLFTDAMREYHEKYGKLPNISDTGTDRDNFNQIIAKIFVDNHDAMIADMSAPGAAGLKTPYAFLAKDTQKAIRDAYEGRGMSAEDSKQVLKNMHKVGNLNNAKNIVKEFEDTNVLNHALSDVPRSISQDSTYASTAISADPDSEEALLAELSQRYSDESELDSEADHSFELPPEVTGEPDYPTLEEEDDGPKPSGPT